MTQTQYSQELYLSLCELGNAAQALTFDAQFDHLVATAMDKFGNINLARAERDADRNAEYEQTMRHVRQTAGYLKYGAYGVYGGSK